MKEIDQLNQALNMARKAFPAKFTLVETEPEGPGRPDAVLDLIANGETTRFLVAVEKRFTRAILGPFRLWAKEARQPVLLVADFVNPKLAADLREDEIAYLDMAGNAHIHTQHLYINVQGKRPLNHATMTVKRGRELFFPAGLRLIYELLVVPETIAAPYRKLAENAGVATAGSNLLFSI